MGSADVTSGRAASERIENAKRGHERCRQPGASHGNLEKVDKFCTYLENNGPAAFHVADGKNVDLNRLYREVIG